MKNTVWYVDFNKNFVLYSVFTHTLNNKEE